MVAPTIQMGNGVVDQQLTPFRRAMELREFRDAGDQRAIPLEAGCSPSGSWYWLSMGRTSRSAHSRATDAAAN